MEYYAARLTNTEHLAQQKFNQSWAQAQELSMKMITMDQTALAYLVNTFGVNGKRKPATTSPPVSHPPNPFGQAPVAAAVGGGSIFGGSVTTAANNPANPFGQAASGGSIFGGTSGQPAISNQQPPNPFGQATNTIPAAASGGSIFGGGGALQQNTGNIFGQPSPAQQSSIFGGGGVSSPPAGIPAPSIFAQQMQQPQQQVPAQGASIFSQNVFGGGGGVIQPQQAVATNIFGQSQLPTTIPVQQQQSTNVFQQQVVPTATAAPTSIFAQAQQAIPVQQAAQPPPPNPFQNASPFGGVGTTGQTPPIGGGGNVFGNLGQMANQGAQSAFFGGGGGAGQQPQPNQVAQGGGNGVFGGQPMSGNPNPPQDAPVGGGAYSKPEELKPEQLEIYRSAAPFELGKVPHMPPPREFCF